jgi:phosphoribosylformylglycinamidine synthase
VHDISDGGLVLAAIEMALASGLGASLVALNHRQLFGEDQARYLVTAPDREADALCAGLKAAGVPAERIGSVTQAAALKIGDGPSISLPDLRSAHEGWFPAFMAGEL